MSTATTTNNNECHKYWRFVNTIKDWYAEKFHRSISDEEAVAIFNSLEKGFADGSLKKA